jgi:hypothetical protein
MSTNSNYIWDVKSLTCGNINGHEQVIRQVVFSIGSNINGVLTEVHNSVGLSAPEPGSAFVPFSDVTQAHIEQWIIDQVGQETIDRIKTLLDSQTQTPREDVVTVHIPPWKNEPSLT